MKSMLIVLALLAPLCLAGQDHHKQAMLKGNKTPKESVPAAYNGACDECKLIVERFNEAVKDPAKMAELKNLLSIFCDQTGYAQECKAIVARLDRIIADLEPFMQDTAAVCRRLHMCSSATVQKMNRIALVYAKKYLNHVEGNGDLVCDECQFVVGELRAIVEEKSTQAQIQDFLRSYICKHLGQYQGACDEVVEQFLPELFEELEQILQNSKQVCQDLSLCPAQNVLVNAQPLHAADNTHAGNGINHAVLPRQSAQRLQSFYRLLNRLQTKNGGVYISCFECELAVNGLVVFLKQEGTAESIAGTLKTEVCTKVLPTDFENGCSDFLGLYLNTVVTLTIGQIQAGPICKMIGACTTKSYRDVMRAAAGPQKHEIACESCRSLTDFLRYEFNSAAFQADVEAGVQYMLCQNLPTSVQNLCENLVKTYVPRAMSKAITLLNSETICKDDLHMCTDALIQQIEDN